MKRLTLAFVVGVVFGSVVTLNQLLKSLPVRNAAVNRLVEIFQNWLYGQTTAHKKGS